MQLKDHVALITGAGSGIGRATAELFIREGARVGALDRDEKDLRDLVKGSSREQILALTADVANPDEMQQAIQMLAGQWGRIDIVFANAGINGVWASLDELKPEDWDQTLDVNLKGTFLTVKYAVPYLMKLGGAVIITSSVNGTRIFSNTGATAYSCSKAAQVAFAKMTALELAKHRIRVNVICPGAIGTHIGESTQARDLEKIREPVEFPEGEIPLTDGQAGSAEQVAQLVLFLASSVSSHISGAQIFIDGAQSLLQG